MIHHLAVGLRWALGLGLLYLALFLREDEEGNYQNRLEDWWLRVAYRKDMALSKSAQFLKGVARLAGSVFDRLFGQRLFSARGFGVSVCYSLASVCASINLLVQYGHHSVSLQLWTWCALLLLFGSLPALVEKKGTEVMWIWGVIVIAIVVVPSAWLMDVMGQAWGNRPVIHFAEFLGMVLVLNFTCDFSFIALTRWMLRTASETNSILGILSIILVDCIFAFVVFAGPFYVAAVILAPRVKGETAMKMVGGLMLLGPALNFVDLVVCSLILILMAGVLVHRLLWPVVERPVYALARYGLISNKKLLAGLAAAILLAPEGKTIWAILSKL